MYLKIIPSTNIRRHFLQKVTRKNNLPLNGRLLDCSLCKNYYSVPFGFVVSKSLGSFLSWFFNRRAIITAASARVSVSEG